MKEEKEVVVILVVSVGLSRALVSIAFIAQVARKREKINDYDTHKLFLIWHGVRYVSLIGATYHPARDDDNAIQISKTLSSSPLHT